ncbi:MAG: DNA cytosine methyltransferase [Bacteroidales bacterium]|nr:DNA cytosine methyltransferase [Bacteroidales bacterium]MCC8177373.1 DNA cytosine methyltransferase [Bacteroidales bacterium]
MLPERRWQVCNSKDFGVPQNRERVFIIGHPEVFPVYGENRVHEIGRREP